MNETEAIAGVLVEHLNDPESAFSIGSLGALAEYLRDAGETTTGSPEALSLATPRGAIRLGLVEGIVPRAYETISACPDRGASFDARGDSPARPGCWQQGVLFCLPAETGTSHARTTITHLGPDREAIDPAERDSELFDLGLGARNTDFCVRVTDPRLIDLLRRHAGRSIFEPENPAMNALIDASPPRVAISALGRIEVYQAIDRAKSPDGPHTHVLPKLLKSKRTHSANIRVPAGYVPCLSLHPPSPLFDRMGRLKPFDVARFQAFQRLLARWGDDEYRREKSRANAAIAQGADLRAYPEPATRHGRSAVRIALRQWPHVMPDDTTARRWSEYFNGRPARAYRQQRG